jgi:NADPH:quinone reductase-like Zn-dependent oxidoreductase
MTTATTITPNKIMMKALKFTYGSTDKITVVQVERPVPTTTADQVQVKVEYAALGSTSFDQVLNRTWSGYFVHKLNNPLFLGWHYAGKVTAVGSGSGAAGGGAGGDMDHANQPQVLAVGDTVLGHLPHSPSTTNGTLAEYVVVPARQCAKYNPSHMDKKVEKTAATAAAATVEANTAYQALRDHGQLVTKLQHYSANTTNNNNNAVAPKDKPTVLVIGAAGGVGSAAVQIAHAMGAHVTATCRETDVNRVKEWGANVVWDRTSVPNPLHHTKDSTFDIIFDTPNALSPSQAMKALKDDGHYIATLPSIPFLWGMLLSMFSKKTVSMVEVKPVAADLEQIGIWLTDGTLKVDIDSIFAIKDTAKALQRQRQSGKQGRVVIQVENGW